MRTRIRQPASATGPRGAPPSSAFTLLECLVYVAVLFVIFGLAFMTFYRTEENNRNLSRNAADILRTLKAGERWRADIRQAVAPIQWRATGAESGLEIPQTNRVVKYVFRAGSVWRQAGPRPAEILSGVANSRMEKDPRRHITGWRWEVELKGKQRVARVKPLFTFLAASQETP